MIGQVPATDLQRKIVRDLAGSLRPGEIHDGLIGELMLAYPGHDLRSLEFVLAAKLSDVCARENFEDDSLSKLCRVPCPQVVGFVGHVEFLV